VTSLVRRRLLSALPALAAVTIAVAVAVALGARSRGGETSAAAWPAGSGGVDAHATIAPRHVLFGDTVQAHVDVAVDRTRVDPDTVRVGTNFSPWQVVGNPVRVRRDAGGIAAIRTDFVLRCVAVECVPTGRSLSFEFPPARISYLSVNGAATARARIRSPWPELVVQSRIAAAGIDSRGERFTPWRADPLELPAPSYRIAPGVLVGALVSGAVLLALAAVVLLLLAWPRRRDVPAPEPEPEPVVEPALTPLEHALLLLEDTARSNGAAEDRRRALELVAEELDAADWGDVELARSAKALAWSEDSPPVELTSSLAARVRSVLPQDETENPEEGSPDEP